MPLLLETATARQLIELYEVDPKSYEEVASFRVAVISSIIFSHRGVYDFI
jgi:hypothetical protein